MKRTLLPLFLCFLFLLLFAPTGWSQTTIAIQDFESMPTLSYTTNSGTFTFRAGSSTPSDKPADSPFYTSGNRSWGVTNDAVEVDFDPVDASSLVNVFAEFNLAAFSLGSSFNGLDGGDEVRIFISTDGGVSFSEEAVISGASNADYPFDGAATPVGVTYDGDNSPQSFIASDMVSIQKFVVLLPNSTVRDQLVLRLVVENDDTAEAWCIDDVRWAGSACGVVPGVPTFSCDAVTAGSDPVDITIPYTGSLAGYSISVSPPLAFIDNGSAIIVEDALEGQTYTVTITDGSPACTFAVDLTVPSNLCENRPFINEFHYDNTGGDVGEFVEIAIPTTGTYGALPLSAYSVVLYNGNNGNSYGSETANNMTTGTPAQGYQYYVWNQSGIQNGAPDGIALVVNGQVIEFLSYEGSFSAANGPAAGLPSTDVGIAESDANTPVGESLQRTGNCAGPTLSCPDGLTWTGPIAETKGMVNANQALPITLTSFTASAERETVVLDWRTATERDNDFFAIERSADGRVFTAIGRVAGMGSTEGETKYAFTDEVPLPGRSYYRLRQVDFDGTTEYYGPITVDRRGDGVDPVRVYPNPIAGEMITIEGEIELGTRATLLDLTGRVLRNWELGEKELRRRLLVNGIAAGTYILRLEDGSTVRTVRFVRQ